MDQIEAAESGTLPSGATPDIPTIPAAWFRDVYFAVDGLRHDNFDDYIPALGPGQPAWLSAERAVWEVFGTNRYADNMLLCEAILNNRKGGFLNGNEFIAQADVAKWLNWVRGGNRTGAENIFTGFNLVSSLTVIRGYCKSDRCTGS
jgi:hypothetical protein